MEKGQISVQTENIFPIIKKFLYSDHEIFLRELISNAVDATQKLKTLSAKGEVSGDLGDLTIEVLVDRDQKTLTIRDKGIGMTADEVKKYLNQVAFSSAHEFLKKHKGDTTIIGNFGLGFYSAFMVAHQVEVITKSYKRRKGVTWSCEGNPEFTLEENDKHERGTEVILHINDDSVEFLEKGRIQQLLDKYCKFLPVPIKFGTRTETSLEGEGENQQEKTVEVDNIINNPEPAWKKAPSELTEADYRDFYEELYPFSTPPLFWIHLNIDYPFNLTGILYFPKLGNNFEMQKNKIQLYSNQVYVTDDVKEIVPEFLTLLHGVIDSPDIPLNVSRSYLQSDSNVKKISNYITKKVGEKLAEIFKNQREEFESKWRDLSVFIKYGMISDDKFFEKAKTFALFQNTEEQYFTIEEYREKIKATQTNKFDKVVCLYSNNPIDHDAQIQAAKDRGYDVVAFDNIIDNHFMQQLEYKMQDLSFVRVDADTIDHLIEKEDNKESVLNETEQNTIKGIFEGLVKERSGTSVVLKPLSPTDQPVTITRPEFLRRMHEMQALQGNQFGDLPESIQLVVNTNHPLIAQKMLSQEEGEQANLAKYLYDLARLNQQMLRGAELTAFVQKSLEFVQ